MPKILIPPNLRRHCHGRSTVQVSGSTVREAIRALVAEYPALRNQLHNPSGEVKEFINLYLGDENIRHLNKSETVLNEDDDLLIVHGLADEHALLPEELVRYDRHLTLPEVGLEGQAKLKLAKVLLVGTGGLGSPLGLYLTAAGVGTLGIVDFDRVDESNLQRQVLHGTKDVGRPKIESARDRLADINPHVNLVTYQTALTSENALEILSDYDIVVDGTDNFATRYLVNDACVLLGKPNVYGSIFRFDGQVSVFHPAGGGPCYRCVYPSPPPPGMVPSCAEGGVLGVLPGVVGTLQATEVIKLILGVGTTLLNRLLLFDALKMRFSELKMRPDEKCPLCGPNATIKDLVDYEEFCGLNLPQSDRKEVTPREFRRLWEKGERPTLLDVRNPHEWEIANLSDYGAQLIPLSELPKRLSELDGSQTIVVQCKTGGRSAKAQDLLIEAGFHKVKNLAGGILRWADDVNPKMRKY